MSQFQHIDAASAQPLIEQQSATVVDTRDAMSFSVGHIRGATPLNNDTLGEFMATADKGRTLIVCCYHGNSSQGAAQFLASQGFNRVYSLDGGYEHWKLVYPELCDTSSTKAQD